MKGTCFETVAPKVGETTLGVCGIGNGNVTIPRAVQQRPLEAPVVAADEALDLHDVVGGEQQRIHCKCTREK